MRDLDSFFRPSAKCTPLHTESTYRDYFLRDILSASGYSVLRLIERTDFGYIRVYFEEDLSGICRVHDIHSYYDLTQEEVTVLRNLGVLSGCDLILRYDRSSKVPKWVSVVDFATKRVIYPEKAE